MSKEKGKKVEIDVENLEVVDVSEGSGKRIKVVDWDKVEREVKELSEKRIKEGILGLSEVELLELIVKCKVDRERWKNMSYKGVKGLDGSNIGDCIKRRIGDKWVKVKYKGEMRIVEKSVLESVLNKEL